MAFRRLGKLFVILVLVRVHVCAWLLCQGLIEERKRMQGYLLQDQSDSENEVTPNVCYDKISSGNEWSLLSLRYDHLTHNQTIGDHSVRYHAAAMCTIGPNVCAWIRFYVCL